MYRLFADNDMRNCDYKVLRHAEIKASVTNGRLVVLFI